MQKTQEVEIRVLIPEQGLPPLLSRLDELGAQKGQTKKIRDAYFCRKAFKSFDETEMNEVGSYSLRLRQEICMNQSRILLNSKTINNHGDHGSWEEHEVEVADFASAWHVLTRTEFQCFFELQKKRTLYTLGDVTINVEDIRGHGCCVELEILSTHDAQDEARTKLMETLDTLTVDKNNVVEKSVTNALMHKLAFQQHIEVDYD